MLDLEALHARQCRIIGLQRRDHAPARVTQLAGFVQVRVVTGGDETAVAGQKRRIGNQRRAEQADQILMPGQVARRRFQAIRQIGGKDGLGDAAGAGKTITDRRQITRPAPVQRQSRQGAIHVGHLFQIGAQRLGLPRFADQRTHCGESFADLGQIARRGRHAPVQKARPGGGHGPVNGGNQRAVASARQALGDFQIASCRHVDLHEATRDLLHRRAQQRQAPALRQVEIFDNRAHGRLLGPVEPTERIERADREKIAQPLLPALAVE